MIKYISVCLLFIFSITSLNVLQAQDQSTTSEYSEVDYRIALNFISDYNNQEGRRTGERVTDITAGISAAMQVAQHKDQYQVNGVFYGTRAAYGLKGSKKVVVILPLDAANRVVVPEGHRKVYVVDMVVQGEFADPCPPNCD